MPILEGTWRALLGGGIEYSNKMLNYAPIAYWPLWEASGSIVNDISGNGYNGSYTGVTLGQTGIGDGNTAPLFDGANDYANIYSAGLASAFSGAEGTLTLWCRVFNSGVWTDSTQRWVIRIQKDSNNMLQFYRIVINNTLRIDYKAGGTTQTTDLSISPTDWFHLAITWSKSADAVKFFYGGVQQGSTQTGLGTWASGTLDSSRTVMGAAITTPNFVWYGYLAHCAVWDSILTPTQIADLATV